MFFWLIAPSRLPKKGSIALLPPSTLYVEVLAALYRRPDNAPAGLNRSVFALKLVVLFSFVTFLLFDKKTFLAAKFPCHVISNWSSRTAAEGHGEE